MEGGRGWACAGFELSGRWAAVAARWGEQGAGPTCQCEEESAVECVVRRWETATRGLLVSQRGRWRQLSWWGRVVGERRGRRAAAGAALLRVLLGRAERESWLGTGPGSWASQGEMERGAGLVWFLIFFPLFLFYFNFKSNSNHLNSNLNLNSNHTQSIKIMHQHECTTS